MKEDKMVICVVRIDLELNILILENVFFCLLLARILLTGNLEENGPYLVALSPDAFTLAVACNFNLNFYDALTGKCDQVVENMCNGK
jgi:hypothetical protein